MGTHTIYLATSTNGEYYSIIAGREVDFFKDEFTLKNLPVFERNIITFPYHYKTLNGDFSLSNDLKSMVILKCESSYESKGLGNIEKDEEFTAFLFEHTKLKLDKDQNKIIVTFNGSDSNVLADVKAVNENEVKIIKKEESEFNYSPVNIEIDL